MRVLQINSVANSGSTGRIAEEIGNVLLANGHERYIAYGRGNATSSSKLIKIGSDKDVYLHGAYTLLTDKHGFASKYATQKFIKELERIKPDLIALHNLHGYYLNVEVLFNYIKTKNIPVTWTFHDCWPFTGHCTHFENVSCFKWKNNCFSCPKSSYYPKSFVDNSNFNFGKKKELFSSLQNLQIITPSMWLGKHVKDSFFGSNDVSVINNGVNIDNFYPSSKKTNYILFVSNVWNSTKGLNDIFKLREMVVRSIDFKVVGLTNKQIQDLPQDIQGIEKTKSIKELVDYYSGALCFINPTYSDNFPTVNLEALACGTPVITYDTGGSPEAIDEQTGFVVDKGDVNGIVEKIEMLKSLNYEEISIACRARAERLYDKKTRYMDYLSVFEGMLKE